MVSGEFQSIPITFEKIMWSRNQNAACLAGWTASVYSERGLAGERAREGKAAVLACGHQIEAEVARLQRRGILGGMVPGPSAQADMKRAVGASILNHQSSIHAAPTTSPPEAAPDGA